MFSDSLELIWFLWAAWLALAFFGAVNSVIFRRNRRLQDEQLAPETEGMHKRAVVIIPTRGTSDHLADFYLFVLSQDYPDYRLIFTFEDADDPALVTLKQVLGEREWTVEVDTVVAGHAVDEGQKVWNQRAAFARLRSEDRIVVFADADMHLSADWLRRLTAPINLGHYELCGGYRWLVPERNSIPNAVASVINASIATVGGPDWLNLLWGGSMALTREAFDKLDVPELFRGSLNDDVHLAYAARRAGYRIAYIRSLLIATPIDYSWARLFEFGRRQYFQGKVYTPWIYYGGLLVTGVYVAGFVTAFADVMRSLGIMVTTGSFTISAIILGAVMFLDIIRGAQRMHCAMETIKMRDEAQAARMGLPFFMEWFTPFWMGVHFLLLISALPLRGIKWAGITYRVRGRRSTTIVNREPAS